MTTIAQGPGLHELARGVFAWIGPEGRTNSGFVVWDEGVLVIDSLYGSALAQGLQEQIRSVTDRPVRYVVDTHEHWDHCFGNQYFNDALFVGHEECRHSLVERPEDCRAFGVSARPDLADEFRAVQILPPVVTYAGTMSLYLDDREVELRYLGRAHTAGDTVVWLPEEQIAFTGDLFVNGGAPYAADGYPRSWVNALRRLEELPLGAVVPGHGDLAEPGDVETLRDWMDTVVQRIAAAHAQGLTEEQAREQLRFEIPDGWRRATAQTGATLISPYYREAQ